MPAVASTRSAALPPGERTPYGYVAVGEHDSLYTAVNPSQSMATVRLPVVSTNQVFLADRQLLFRDAGCQPRLSGDVITIGPEQMVLVGFGEYSRPRYDLGIQHDVVIPSAIGRLGVEFVVTGHNEVTASVLPPLGVTGSAGRRGPQAPAVAEWLRRRPPDPLC